MKLEKIIAVSISQSMSVWNKVGMKILKKVSRYSLPQDKRFMSWNDFLASGRYEDKAVEVVSDGTAPAVIVYTGVRREVPKV